ncbi:hypothetical protein [Colwellia sp. Bg11-28]|uniref:hypothetical protein n=1 Tax=Colwellia sp. Bg11-28 TaxID=2058305 RepID=UPI000C31C809|nr:hypothetical protein [Colwellia sp. Bg11-28]PKH88373.1 hypothetical protein CXF79_06340 [Colwellia sp. Bg11-28]
MDAELIESFLKNNPKARRAKEGVIIDTDNGFLHLRGAIKTSDYEGLGEDATFFAPFCSVADIKKINSPKTASDFLLQLRAESIVDNPRLNRVFLARKGNKTNWSLEKYYLDRKREETYLSNLSKGNYEKLKSIPSGSVYLDGANAICTKTKAGNIIAISEPLEYFLYFMNIFFYGEDFGIKDEDTQASFRIAQRIMAGHESFDFDIDPRGTLPEHIHGWMKSITDLQYQFILGHEYSHHLLGHVKDSNLRTDSLSSFMAMHEGKHTIQHYKYSHKLEYDADWYSIKNIKGNSKFKDDLSKAAFLTLMYLETSRIVLDYTNPRRTNQVSSHPDPSSRIYKIRKKLNNKYGFSKDQLENNLGYLKDYTEQFISKYLVFNFDSFEEYGSHYLPSYKTRLLNDRVDY